MSIKIHRNDVALAHAAAKSEIGKAAEQLMSGRGRKIILANSVKEFFKHVDALFPGRIIDAGADRVIGSRARAGVVVVDTNTDGHLGVVQLIFNGRSDPGYRVTPHPIPIIIQRHAVSRSMQRLVGKADLSAAITTIQPHLHAIVQWVSKNNPLEPGTQVNACGRGIEVAGDVDDDGLLRLKTVITAESMTSENRRAWAMSATVQIRTNLTK